MKQSTVSGEESSGRWYPLIIMLAYVCCCTLLLVLFDLHLHNSRSAMTSSFRLESYIVDPLIVLFTAGIFYAINHRFQALFRRSRRELFESERRYRGLVESQLDFVVRVNSAGKFIFVNNAFAKLIGKTPEELLTDSFKPYVSPDDLPSMMEVLHAVQAPPHRHAFDIQVLSATGWRWVAWEMCAIQDADGNVVEIQGSGRDITERKETEQALREKEQFLSTVFTSIHDGLAILDTNHTILQVNLEIAGKFTERMPLIGKKCFQAFHGRAEVCSDCPAQKVLETGEPALAIVARDDGRAGRLDELYCFPMHDPDSKAIVGVVECVRDVTDRVAIENELRASEETNRALLNAIPDIIFRLNREGRFLDTTTKNYQDLYLPPEQFIGRTMREVMPDKLADESMQYIEKSLRTGEIQFYEYPLPVNGEERFFETRMVPCGMNEVIAIVRDITERKQAEVKIQALNTQLEQRISKRSCELAAANKELARANEALEAERAYLSSAIELLPIPICFMTRDGEPSRMNSALKALGERHQHTALDNVTLLDPLTNTPIQENEWPHERALRGEVISSQEYIFKFPDGAEIPVMLHAAPIVVGDEPAAVVIAFQDITSLKQVDQAKDDFLAHLAHELLTPLTSILGWAQMAQSSKNNDKLINESLAVIERNARRQKRLVDDLLDISRIIHGKLFLQSEPCDLWYLTEQAVESRMHIASERRITLSLEPIIGPAAVYVDPSKMVQVINNLLNNAIKYTEPGGEVTIQIQVNDNWVVLRVSDTGRGISREQMAKLFQPFCQFHPSGGLGIGLALVNGIIDEHGGRISAESSGIPGEGSIFTVELPVLQEVVTPADDQGAVAEETPAMP